MCRQFGFGLCGDTVHDITPALPLRTLNYGNDDIFLFMCIFPIMGYAGFTSSAVGYSASGAGGMPVLRKSGD